VSDPKNIALWSSVCTTDAKYTKQFSRGGGFKGTATNATWLAREATRAFGPCGIGWGFDVVDERYVPGKPGDIIHVVRVRLWYMLDGIKGAVEQFGQTTFVGTNKSGAFTDEEAPKKSITDAVSKCLSLLGFAADIYMGMFDDNKYLDEREQAYGASDLGTPLAAPGVTYGPEEQTRADAQTASTRAICDGLIGLVTGAMHVDDVVALLEEHISVIDAMGPKEIARFGKACLEHVKAGRVEGMTEIGFREMFKAVTAAHRKAGK